MIISRSKLSFSGPKVQVIPIDIGEVHVEDGELEDDGYVNRIIEEEIECCDENYSCIFCKEKVRVVDDICGECSKCGMLIKLKKCPKALSAKGVVTGVDGVLHNIMIFDNIVSKATDGIGGTSVEKHCCLLLL